MKNIAIIWFGFVALIFWNSVHLTAHTSPNYIVATAAKTSKPQTAVDLNKQIDEEINRLITPDEPGAAIAVVKDGKLLFSGYYGLADVETNRLVQSEDAFCIASLSKQFAGVAVLLLVEDGKLGLDDDIKEYFPELPIGTRNISIRRLLSHTSGLPELTQIDAFMTDIATAHTPDQIIAYMTQGDFRSEPGEKYIYNNTGYTIVVALIEKLSGMSYSEFLSQRIFSPLKMSRTFAADIKNPGTNAVNRYQKSEKGFEPSVKLHLSNLIGGGSIVTTALDMAKWGTALISGIGLPVNYAELWKPNLLSNGESTRYGLGLGTAKHNGHNIVYHPGQGSGMNSFGVLFPDDQLYIVVMRNMSKPTNSSQVIALKIADLIFDSPHS